MKKNFFFILFLLSIFNYSYGLEKNSVLENKIAINLRCLVCQGQSIYDSQSEFALSVKLIIKRKINQGNSEKEIYDYFKNQYGEWILYEPEINKKTIFLWLFPLILFTFGGYLIFRKFFIK